MRRWVITGSGVVLGLVLGCCGIEPYECSRDEDCNRDGAQGQCLPDAACAYPDDDGRCDSGWIRSPNATEDPGGCVSPSEDLPTEGTTVDGSGGGSTG